MARVVLNAERRSQRERAGRPAPIGPPPSGAPRAFHRRLPGYAPTPLLAAPALATELGLGELWIKHEARRFGLPAFKILGGSWAVYRLLERELGVRLDGWRDLDELRARAAALGPVTLVTATDGNHGRGVARVARLFGFQASIWVPAGTVPARIEAIASEGARVHVVEGSYDEAVERAAGAVGPRTFLVQDTSFEGYEDVPRWVIEGYETLLEEVDEALAAAGARPPELVLVPVGVGALLAAVLSHATHGAWPQARVVSVEPEAADCTLAALRAGEVVRVSGPHDSMMAGLNCGTLATIVWPLVRDGLDAALAIEDARCVEALRALAGLGIEVGESGAASLAGLLALLGDPACREAREALGVGPRTSVLVLATEGVTDPEHWANVTGRGSAPAGC